jgi:hypothetical protein
MSLAPTSRTASVGPEVDIAHSQTEYHHNPHDQNLSDLQYDDGLRFFEGVINAMSFTLIGGFSIWLVIKVIEHWEEVTQWIYSVGFTR